MKKRKTQREIFLAMIQKIGEHYKDEWPASQAGFPLALENTGKRQYVVYSQGRKMPKCVYEALTDVGVYAKARFGFSLSISDQVFQAGQAERANATYQARLGGI